jgi:tetratricopeptide (TPR) repeat protein
VKHPPDAPRATCVAAALLLLALCACSSPSPGPQGKGAAGAPLAPGAASSLALANIAASRAAAGDLDGAESALLEALERSPAESSLLAELGRVRLLSGRPAEAVSPALRAAEAAGGSNPRLYLLAASARLRAGETRQAEQDLERLERKFGPAPLLRVARGLLRESAGRKEAAELEYAAALSADPGCEEALSGLVKLRFERGDAAGALAAVRSASAGGVGPKIWEAQALRRLGRIDEAEAPLRAAVALEPDHAPALAELGALRATAGDYAEARALLTRALALAPDLEAARANLEQLERPRGEATP